LEAIENVQHHRQVTRLAKAPPITGPMPPANVTISWHEADSFEAGKLTNTPDPFGKPHQQASLSQTEQIANANMD
jgi:hypothetical protein